MDDHDDATTAATDPFSPSPGGGFERDVDDRRRLEHQFALLREDFNLWFDGMLRLGGLSTDPDRATWSVLDIGCGEGRFTREIARRYPNARAVGFDDITTEPLRYPLGGATRYGQRWHAYLLTNMSSAKHPIVDVFGLMEEADYDRRFERLAAEPVLRLYGEIRFLVTLARRAGQP